VRIPIHPLARQLGGDTDLGIVAYRLKCSGFGARGVNISRVKWDQDRGLPLA
jgi:hypothetical protein